jgi:hypothetical protein
MIKPRLKYSGIFNDWSCSYFGTTTTTGSTPEQAYRRWRVENDRRNFIEVKDELRKFWPTYLLSF